MNSNVDGFVGFETPEIPFGPTRIASQPITPSRPQRHPVTSGTQNIPSVEEQVAYYKTWLSSEAKAHKAEIESGEISAYVMEARKVHTVGHRRVTTFAPFVFASSALRTITKGQVIALGVLGLVIVCGIIFFPLATLAAITYSVNLYYFGSLLLTFWLSKRAHEHSSEGSIPDEVVHALAEADWPPYTILCPLYKETEVVHQFAKAMQALNYPAEKLQVLLLTEEDDQETRAAIRAAQLPAHFQIVTVPAGQPRTKPRACNYGLLEATGRYVVIFDAEDIPDPLQLKKAVLTFAKHGPELGCVQAKLNFYNTNQNMLTRWFTIEYSTWFESTLPGLEWANLPLPLGGTSNHFRVETLRKVGAWDAFNVTEDCDLGLRLSQYGLKTIVLDSITREEANADVGNWIRQRSRWIKGYMQTYLIHMRQPTEYLKQNRLYDFISLNLIIGGRTGILFVNPIMWLLLICYIPLRPWLEETYHLMFPGLILYVGVLCLFFGNVTYVYTHFVGCLKRRQYSLIKWGLTMPIYWAMASYAAYRALIQLVTKPHYWEKTKHGLHLAYSEAVGSSLPPALAAEETARSEPAMRPTEPVLQPLSGWLTRSSSEAAGSSLPPALAAEETARSEPALRPTEPVLQPLSGWLTCSSSEAAGSSLPPALAAEEAVRSTPEVGPTEPVLQPLSGWLTRSSVGFQHLLPFQIGSTNLTDAVSYTTPTAISTSSVVVPATGRQSTLDPDTDVQAEHTSPGPARRSAWPVFRWTLSRDRWLIATVGIACIASILSLAHFAQNNELLMFADAASHLGIARRVVDNVTPGFAQLGGIWLPLPHLAMLPFVQLEWLWRTGLAGACVAAPCYLIAVIYSFLAARRLTKDSRASFIGSLVLILNPNILYLQSTPLSELVFLATMAAACYYFLAWVQDDDPYQLILLAAATFLTTLARYDGWPLFLCFAVLIVLISWIKGRDWDRCLGNLAIFGLLGSLGIALWMLWCAAIFGDPLYFQHSEFSAQAQQQSLISHNVLFTYHNLGESIRTFTINAAVALGPGLLALSVIGLVVLFLRRRFSTDTLAALTYLVPCAFYVVSLYTGQAVLWSPESLPAGFQGAPFFNTRYGVVVIVPAVIFIAILVGYLSQTRRLPTSLRFPQPAFRLVGPIACVIAILGQTALTLDSGVIVLQDAQRSADCMASLAIVTYLFQHYDGGKILANIYASGVVDYLGPMDGIAFHNLIYEGSGKFWRQALGDPSASVDWIVANPSNPKDQVTAHIDLSNPTFLSQFTPVLQDADTGRELFHRIGQPLIQGQGSPPNLFTARQPCDH